MKNAKCLNCACLDKNGANEGRMSCVWFDRIPNEYVSGEADYSECMYTPIDYSTLKIEPPTDFVTDEKVRDCDTCRLFDKEALTCSAFPEGAPISLVATIGHDKVLPGQNLNRDTYKPE